MVVVIGGYIGGYILYPHNFTIITFGVILGLAIFVGLIYLIGSLVEILQESYVWNWFWNKKYFPLGYPWTITLTVLYVSSYFVAPLWFSALSYVLLVIALTVLAIVVVVAIIVGIATLYESATVRLSNKTGVLTTGGVVVEYLKAKKKNICPYIQVTD